MGQEVGAINGVARRQLDILQRMEIVVKTLTSDIVPVLPDSAG
jgi:hypothetical protein